MNYRRRERLAELIWLPTTGILVGLIIWWWWT